MKLVEQVLPLFLEKNIQETDLSSRHRMIDEEVGTFCPEAYGGIAVLV